MAGGVVVAAGAGYPGKMTPYVCFTCIVAAMGGLIFGYDIGISVCAVVCLGDGSIQVSWCTERVILALYHNRHSSSQHCELFYGEILGGWGWRVSLGLDAVPAIFIAVSASILPDTPNYMLDRNKPEEAKAMLRKIKGLDDEGIRAKFDDLVAASKASHLVEHPWRNTWKRQYRPQLTLCTLIPFFQQMNGINVVMFYAQVLFKTLDFGSDASLMSAVITVRQLVKLPSEEGFQIRMSSDSVIEMFLAYSCRSIICVVTASNVNIILRPYCDFSFGSRNQQMGEEKLFLVGDGVMFVFQIAVAVLTGLKFGTTGVVDNLTTGYAVGVIMCICTFVAAFAFSWGPLGWLVPSEISPLEVRSPN
uniref:Uncharacterized protein n=1 Tax=Kalanchoe fedtschenkoi TaxID=63787 RepID=A0A7N0V3A9_KALFE